MAKFASDTEMFDTMRDKLYASVISDIVDSLGARYQGMRPDVRPVYQGAVVVGRAYPVLTADVYKFIDDPYGPEIDAVDALKPNDVMVVCTQRSTRTCFWGELLATAARADIPLPPPRPHDLARPAATLRPERLATTGLAR